MKKWTLPACSRSAYTTSHSTPAALYAASQRCAYSCALIAGCCSNVSKAEVGTRRSSIFKADSFCSYLKIQLFKVFKRVIPGVDEYFFVICIFNGFGCVQEIGRAHV